MARQQTYVTIPSSQVELNGINPYCHDIKLYRDDGDEYKIPYSQDIVTFKVNNPPTHLKRIHILIGGSRVASFDREDFIDGKNLFPEGLPVSKAYYHIVKVSFGYDHDYIHNNEESIMEDEYNEEPVLSDTEEEFFDGYEYTWGRRVTGYKRTPTGRQVKKVLKHAIVDTPELIIEVAEVGGATTKIPARIPVWESIVINQENFDEEYLNRLIEKHQLHIPSGEDVKEVYNKGQPFTGKVRNIIHFSNGMAGKMFVFN